MSVQSIVDLISMPVKLYGFFRDHAVVTGVPGR